MELILVSKTGPKRVVSLLVVVGNPRTIVVAVGDHRCFNCHIARWFYRNKLAPVFVHLPKNVYLYGVISKGRKGYEEYAEK